MNMPVAETRRTFPKSVQPGVPKINPPQAGAKRYIFGELFEVIQRPVKLDDDKEYDLVTVKRARGGIEHRARMKGSQVAVKSQFYLEEGDFLISKRQIVHGACGIVKRDFAGSIVSNEYSVLRCNPVLDLQFLGYLSHSIYFQQTCFHSSIGVHIEKMIFKLQDWLNWPVNIPSFPEQKKIASFLGAVDEKIAALRERQAGLEKYKRGLMQALFSQTLRFTKPDGTAFPDWEEKRLRDVATRSTVKNGNLEYMRVLTNSAARGVVDQGDYFDKEIANAENLAGYYVLKRGDFVYNPRISVNAPVGPIKRNDLGDGVMSPLYTVFRFEAKDTEFFNIFFATTVWHNYMKAVANYGARHDRMAITSSDLMNMPLPYPHPDEQGKIADALTAIDAKISAVDKQVARMEEFKKGLLQQMFV